MMTLDPGLAGHLQTYLTGARWFAGKGRRATVVDRTCLPWLTPARQWPAVRFEVVEVSYDDTSGSAQAGGAYELYQLAVSYYAAPQPGVQHAEIARVTEDDLGPVVAYDAMQDPAAGRILLSCVLDGSTHGDDVAGVSFTLVPGVALTPDLRPMTYTGQQSNTSVIYGDVAMLKLFRRLEVGRNLDIEVHEALGRLQVADVARLYGWVDAQWARGDQRLHADLAMLVEQLPDAEDGWGLALDVLQLQTSFSEDSGLLGTALAEIHESLRNAFPTATRSGAELAARMKERLSRAAAVAPALEPYVTGLVGRFDALAETELATQRVHGDFHLGQTLRTPGGWKIIDFEGEPVKTLAERAAPDSVWRDIAGLLRSLDYAAASVPGPASREWALAARNAFLRAYAGGELTEVDAAVLRAYEADKAIYEVIYEVRNRPDWVNIPLAAIAALSTASASDDLVKE